MNAGSFAHFAHCIVARLGCRPPAAAQPRLRARDPGLRDPRAAAHDAADTTSCTWRR